MVCLSNLKVFYNFWPVRYSVRRGYFSALLALLAATSIISRGSPWPDRFFSYNQDHQLKSSQLESIFHSVGDSDV